jgi:serine/threonine protein kinase
MNQREFEDNTRSFVPISSGTMISRYKILEKIGAGGMGEVYLAEDSKLGRQVALKFLSFQALDTSEAKTRFVNEARSAAALDHENICSIYEIDESDDRMFIAMAYIEGQSIKDKIQSGPMRLQEVVNLGIDISRGLQEAHEKGIIHRDIKSANVMVNRKGQGKITDFGLAKLVGGSQLTKTGTSMGTAAYMSPEQVRGESVDHRSDIWSLGVILYEMVTGRLPFKGDNEHSVTHQIIHEDADPLTALRTGVPMELERIVAKCLKKDPSDRYQHVDDVQVDLRNVDKEPTVAKPGRGLQKYVLPISIVTLSILLYALFKSHISADTKGVFENPLAGATFSKITNIEGSDAAISPDGKFVAFISDHDGQYDIWVSQIETGNVYNRTQGQGGDVRSGLHALGFSANSSQIILTGSPLRKLQTIPLLGGQIKNVLVDGVGQADWSPDGRRVVYFKTSPGDPLYVSDGDGTNSRMILDSEKGMHQHYPTWSHDGDWIYLVRGRENVWDTDLWRIRPDGSELERLTKNRRNVTCPAPLNERIVLFVARNEDGSGPWLWAHDIESAISYRVSIGLEKYSSLSVNQDGNLLVTTIIHPEADLWSVPILNRVATDDDADIYELPAVYAQGPRFGGKVLYFLSSRGTGIGLWKYEDDQVEEVWSGAKAALFKAPAVSPDGKSVAITLRRDGKNRIHLLSADGSNLRKLSETIDVRGTASWSPDARWILTGGYDVNGSGLFKISVDSKKSERIVDGEALNPVWSPDGDLIVYIGEQVGTFSSIVAIKPDGTRIEFPEIKVWIRGDRYRFLPDGSGLVYMGGLITPQEFWLLDFSTMKSRKLTELTKGTQTNSFDISPDGLSIVFDRLRENSEIVLIELANDGI